VETPSEGYTGTYRSDRAPASSPRERHWRSFFRVLSTRLSSVGPQAGARRLRESVPEVCRVRNGFSARAPRGVECPASSTQTQELLGWQPTGPTLLDDLAAGSYFRAP
jgi:hypothetical protein